MKFPKWVNKQNLEKTRIGTVKTFTAIKKGGSQIIKTIDDIRNELDKTLDAIQKQMPKPPKSKGKNPRDPFGTRLF